MGKTMRRSLSLGAGVQSSTIALMAEVGELEPIDFAIFADTGDEPQKVYAWLDWLELQLSYRVYRVQHPRGSLASETFRERTSRHGHRYGKNFIPTFGVDEHGGRTMLPRKCTTDFKLEPIHKKLRQLIKPPRLKKGRQHEVLVECVIGISYDEAHRMKPPWHPWIRNVYPLVERRLTRWHCLEWMRSKGYPEPPRSACIYCPYHSDREWLLLKHEQPIEFAKAVKFERRLWETAAARNVSSREFLHADRVPLDQVEFREDRNLQLFGNEMRRDVWGVNGSGEDDYMDAKDYEHLLVRSQDVLDLVDEIRPQLAGLAPNLQGAALADLVSLWLAGHPRRMREDLLSAHMEAVRNLTELNALDMYGPAGHPGDQ